MTDRYAVVGNPVAHSRSPAIHARFARACGQDIEYGRLLAPLDGFAETVQRFRAEGGRGLNVTLPFKIEAFALAGERSARAEAAGAANLLAFDGSAIRADNTDGAGLVADIEQRLALPLAGASVLLLGAGGAARGVVLPLLEAGVARLVIANRNAERARSLAGQFRALPAGRSFPQPSGGGFELAAGSRAAGEDFDLVINATSTGLAGEALPLPAAVFASARLAYDMVYAARPTAFMAQAQAAGCPLVSDGLGMLVEQAAESFLVWRGVRPEAAPVYAALRAELSAEAAG
jgi:shikimate dehydrogenase